MSEPTFVSQHGMKHGSDIYTTFTQPCHLQLKAVILNSNFLMGTYSKSPAVHLQNHIGTSHLNTYCTIISSALRAQRIIVLRVEPGSLPTDFVFVFFFSLSTVKHFHSRSVSSAAADTTVSPSGDMAM